jgi:excisionase family DNA binding protein
VDERDRVGRSSNGTAPPAASLADLLLGSLDDAALRELAERIGPHLPAQINRLLDAREAAAVLGLHPDTLLRMARDGRIWAQKAGREWRFRADRLEIRPVTGSDPEAISAGRPGRSRPPVRASVAAIRGAP